jgi:hypothetical protein
MGYERFRRYDEGTKKMAEWRYRRPGQLVPSAAE